MGCSDEDAFRIAILCVRLNTSVVGPSNSCTADADFLLGKRGHGLRGTWHLIPSSSLRSARRVDIDNFDLSNYRNSFLLLPPLSLSQVNPLCIPPSSCCAPEP